MICTGNKRQHKTFILFWVSQEELTHPAFARPVKTCPPIMVVVSFADPAITPPMTPIAAGITINHFLPNLSLKKP